MATNSNKTKHHKEGSLAILAAQFYVVTILVILTLLSEQFDIQPESLIYPCCLLLVILTIWFFWSWRLLTKRLFDPYVLFLISALLFNGGRAFLEVFYLNKNGIFPEDNFSSETILKTLVIVILGLSSFHLGAVLSAATAKVNSPSRSAETRESLTTKRDNCRLVGWSLLSISFLPALLSVKDAIIVVLHSGYFALYQQESVTSFSAAPKLLAQFIIPATLFLLAGSKERNKGKVVSVVTVVIYSISQFFLGQRSTAVMPMIACAWLWHRIIRPLPTTLLLNGAAITIFIIFPLVKAIRSEAGEERLSIGFLLNAFTSIDNPVIAALSEMGFSMITIAYIWELVPSVRDFDMGNGYFYALLTLIPNLFWEIHPTQARGLAGGWLIWQVDPGFADTGGGLGFSFIAEAYLNFGWLGGAIALAVMGFLFSKLTLWAITSDEPAKMAMLASFISFFLFYPRDESANQIRPLVWYALIPYLGVCALNSLRPLKNFQIRNK